MLEDGRLVMEIKDGEIYTRRAAERGIPEGTGMGAQTACGSQDLPGVSSSRRIEASWLVLQGKSSSPRLTLAVTGPPKSLELVPFP